MTMAETDKPMTEERALRIVLSWLLDGPVVGWPYVAGRLRDVHPTMLGATWGDILDDPVKFCVRYRLRERLQSGADDDRPD